jgi:hypothetical protein
MPACNKDYSWRRKVPDVREGSGGQHGGIRWTRFVSTPAARQGPQRCSAALTTTQLNIAGRSVESGFRRLGALTDADERDTLRHYDARRYVCNIAVPLLCTSFR